MSKDMWPVCCQKLKTPIARMGMHIRAATRPSVGESSRYPRRDGWRLRKIRSRSKGFEVALFIKPHYKKTSHQEFRANRASLLHLLSLPRPGTPRAARDLRTEENTGPNLVTLLRVQDEAKRYLVEARQRFVQDQKPVLMVSKSRLTRVSTSSDWGIPMCPESRYAIGSLSNPSCASTPGSAILNDSALE